MPGERLPPLLLSFRKEPCTEKYRWTAKPQKSEKGHSSRAKRHKEGQISMSRQNNDVFSLYRPDMPKHLNEIALMRIIVESRKSCFPNNFVIEDMEIEIPHPFFKYNNNGKARAYGKIDLRIRCFGKSWLVEVKGLYHKQPGNDRQPVYSAMKAVLYNEIYNLSSSEKVYPAIMVPSDSLDPIMGCCLSKLKVGYIKYKRQEDEVIFNISGMRSD